jgi:hypothetical protein
LVAPGRRGRIFVGGVSVFAAVVFGAACSLGPPPLPVYRIPPGLIPSTSFLSFGSVPVGSSAVVQVTLTADNGTAYLTTAWVGGPNPAHYVQFAPVNLHGANDCLEHPIVTQGQSCVLNVAFAPTTTEVITDVALYYEVGTGNGFSMVSINAIGT